MRDKELIVAQTCVYPFVKYCIVIVVDLGLLCNSQCLCCGRVSLSKKGGMETKK